jgi:hypothetical protein
MDQQSAHQRLAALVGGYFVSQAISVAARLGIADRLRDGPRTADELARATGTHARSLHRLLRTLAGFGVFAADDGGRFRLTELADLLCAGAPGSLGAAAVSIGELYYAAFGELHHSVGTGLPAFDRVFGRPLFDYLATNPGAARTFDAGLVDLRAKATAAVLDAYDFSGVRRLVDVGGGTGDLISVVLEKYPTMRGILFDRPHVVAQARAAVHAAAGPDRCTLVGGNFFESVPAGGDVYLLRHVVHDWDDDRANRILTNCRRAMTRPGKLLLVESVIRPGNEPSLGKVMDLAMLALTSGRERTEPEYRELLGASGFRLARVIPTSADIHVIEAAPTQGTSR